MKLPSGTGRRLFVSFAALVAIFGVASAFALAGLEEINESLHRVKEHEAGVRRALELARAVRDQYAHQAHTIIIGDASHVEMYEESRARVQALAKELGGRVTSEAQRRWVDEITRKSDSIDTLFRERLLPAVLAREEAAIQSVHERLLFMVFDAEQRADELADHSEKEIARFEEHAESVQRASFRWTVALLLGATLFAAALGAYITRSIARPVKLLAQGAARVGAGDLDTRIHIATKDEFGRLAREFNAMTAALKDHQQKLVDSEKLAGIGRLAAGVAHEINNPLGVILGYARLLRRRHDGPLGEDLGIIEDEAVRCQEIVAGLLDLARPVKAGDDEVSLRALADEVVARLRDAGAFEQVVVSVEGDAQVRGAEGRLRQVVMNLVKNAAEAARPDGRVEVRIARAQAEATLAVSDTGAGLDPARRDRLFEPFFTTKAKGTGLGLAVSLAIARAHGGAVEAGERAGGGAVFTLRLPEAARREVA